MKQKVLSAFALMALVVVGLLLPAPASAAEGAAWFKANQESSFTHQVATLKGDNTSVETTEAFDGYDVVAGKLIFQFRLVDGAKCTAGAPRVFATVGDTTVNTWDANIGEAAQCGGEPDAEGWTEVTMDVPAGKMTALGVVYDNGAGGSVEARVAVPISDNAWGTVAFDAKDAPVEESPSPSPSASESESPSPSPSASESESASPSASASPSGSATTPPVDGPTEITVPAPTMGEVTCDDLWVNVTEMASVEWSFGEQTDTTIVVIATATEGYVFADGKTQLTWTLTFTPPTGCEATPAPTATETAGSGGSVGSGTDGGGDLPVTGAKVLGVAGVGGLLVAIGGLLFVWARRKRDEQDGIDPDATVEMRAV